MLIFRSKNLVDQIVVLLSNGLLQAMKEALLRGARSLWLGATRI
jgi:hypothetical protein